MLFIIYNKKKKKKFKMENGGETYKCEKCGNTLLKSNKLLHDLKCTEKKDININLNINPNNNNNNKNQNFININEIDQNAFDLYQNDIFECDKCNARMKMKDKLDHLLCHQLEQGDSGVFNNGSNIFDSVNNNNNYLNNNFNLNNPNNFININTNIHRNNRNIHQNNNHNINRLQRNFININLNDDDNDEEDNEDNNNNYNIQISNNIQINGSFEGDSNNNNNEDEYDDGNEDLNSLEEDGEFDDFDIDDNGLDDHLINTYPVSKIKDISKLDEEKKKCCICLENYKNNDETIILPCVHIFHSNCIKHWMKRQDSCPICKNKINI